MPYNRKARVANEQQTRSIQKDGRSCSEKMRERKICKTSMILLIFKRIGDEFDQIDE